MEDQRKQTLLHLYDEPREDSDLRALLADASVRDEYRTLSEVKFKLDRRPAVRPDAEVLDRIMAAATAPPSAQRTDRPAVHRFMRPRRLLFSGLAVAAALVLAVALGWFSTPDPETVPGTTPPALAADTELSWDDATHIRQVYRRMDSMRPQSPLSWDEPPVPLESLPSGRPGNLVPVGAN
ncbi:MAG: hypothetical protein RIE53_12750 [Rhodothermales bacterium]